MRCLIRPKLTWEKVEDLKMEHCYIAADYASEVRLFQVISSCPFSRLYLFHSCLMVKILNRKVIRKLKKKLGVGSFLGLQHRSRSPHQKKKLLGKPL